jgi:hypothetical protein
MTKPMVHILSFVAKINLKNVDGGILQYLPGLEVERIEVRDDI